MFAGTPFAEEYLLSHTGRQARQSWVRDEAARRVAQGPAGTPSSSSTAVTRRPGSDEEENETTSTRPATTEVPSLDARTEPARTYPATTEYTAARPRTARPTWPPLSTTPRRLRRTRPPLGTAVPKRSPSTRVPTFAPRQGAVCGTGTEKPRGAGSIGPTTRTTVGKIPGALGIRTTKTGGVGGETPIEWELPHTQA